MDVCYKSLLPSMVVVGMEGEQYAREVKLDISREMSMWPDSAPTLIFCRPGEHEAYPASITWSGNTVVWTPDAFATAIKSQRGKADGALQLIFTTPDSPSIIGKSNIIRYVVGESLETSENVPEPYEQWVNSLLEAASRSEIARAGAESAETGAITAKEAAETAQGIAESARDVAVGAKDKAVASANKAEREASAAESARQDAQNSAGLAEDYASQSEQSADSAGTYESNARLSAQSAAQSATTATTGANTASAKASEAQGYAAQAGQSAGNASTSEANAATSAGIASQKASDAAQSEANAATSADRAEQAATTAGYMNFYIDERGHLIYERVNVDHVDFELVNGRLIAIWQ